MIHNLPTLPYETNALLPHISQETIEYHYGKHHKAYVEKLNQLIADTEFKNKSLEEIILTSNGPIFNNAAQAWNHTFYWNCLTPNALPTPKEGKLLDAIFKAYGTFDAFKTKFINACLATFGSGWVWLVKNEKGDLDIISTSNAENPLKLNLKPLLTCDVWEHAYYIDYRNARAKYVEGFMNIINWKFVEENLKK